MISHQIYLVLGIVVLLIVLLFSFVILFGAPFLPTLKSKTEEALEILDLKPGQTLIDLGCGDGRMLIAAARKGINSVGYELNPLLFFISWLRTRVYRDKVKVVFGNYWLKQWPSADAMYVFLLASYMDKLNTRIVQQYKSGFKLVSFAYPIKSTKPSLKRGGFFLYIYP